MKKAKGTKKLKRQAKGTRSKMLKRQAILGQDQKS